MCNKNIKHKECKYPCRQCLRVFTNQNLLDDHTKYYIGIRQVIIKSHGHQIGVYKQNKVSLNPLDTKCKVDSAGRLHNASTWALYHQRLKLSCVVVIQYRLVQTAAPRARAHEQGYLLGSTEMVAQSDEPHCEYYECSVTI